MNIDKLRAHLLLDPDTRDFAGMTAAQVAADLKTPTKERNRALMSGIEVQAEIVDAEYDALTDGQKAQLLALTSAEFLNPFGFAANVIKDLFNGSQTLTNLAAARTETVSAEEFYALGNVKAGHVEEARR